MGNFGRLAKTNFRNLLNSFIFPFSFLLFQSLFSNSFSKNSNHFEFESKSLNQINQMHRHVCSTMLLHPRMSFNIMKNIIFPIFHEHQKFIINHFNSIFNIEIFRVLHILTCTSTIDESPKLVELC